MPEPVKVTFHGGLGDIGRNCATVETADAMLVLDCGVMFPSEIHPGVDFVLPDLSYIFERADKVVGCISTHGHEDHIGALAHLLAEIPTTVHGSPFTLGLAKRRVKEQGQSHRAQWEPLADGERRSIGPFDCEFLPVTHSVPGGLISAIGTPQGIILHSSDFKLDLWPVDGRRTDLPRIGELAQDPGIRLLLADSTNADLPGSTTSETGVRPALDEVFHRHPDKRLIVACFASHIHRVQQVVDCAVRHDRRIATLGLSMERNVRLGRDLGILRLDSDRMVSASETDDMAPGEVCVLSTGSQAESRSSLATAARGDNRWISLGTDDTVVLSSNPIPGNEVAVAKMINQLMTLGAEVVHAGQLHTSGHGKRDELATLHTVASPEWFVPVHGEYRHMLAHADLAVASGMDEDRVLVARDGDQVELTDSGLELHRHVTPGDYLLVNGDMVGPDRGVLSERKWLGDQGVVVVAVTARMSKRSGRKLRVEVASRGWLDAPEKEEVEQLVAKAVKGVVADADVGAPASEDELAELDRLVRKAAGKCIRDVVNRRPMVVPTLSGF